MCTIAHTPRLPEHCIEYVKVLLWSKENPFGGEDTPIDGDDPQHTSWIHEQAVLRATEYGEDTSRRCSGTGAARVQALLGCRRCSGAGDARVQALLGYRRCSGAGAARVQALLISSVIIHLLRREIVFLLFLYMYYTYIHILYIIF